MNFLRTKVFLIDGIGALLSALTIGIILPYFQIGMPKDVLNTLSSIAALFGTYSLSCFFCKRNVSSLLKAIVVANSLYCIAIAVVLFYFSEHLSWLATAYFSIEVVIIIFLVCIEIWVLNQWVRDPGQR